MRSFSNVLHGELPPYKHTLSIGRHWWIGRSGHFSLRDGKRTRTRSQSLRPERNAELLAWALTPHISFAATSSHITCKLQHNPSIFPQPSPEHASASLWFVRTFYANATRRAGPW